MEREAPLLHRITPCTSGDLWFGVALGSRGECLCWRLPGGAEHELVEDVHGAEPVLAGGVDVAADVEAILGDVVAGEAAGDLLLGFQGADAALAALLFVGHTPVSVVNRSTSACRPLQNSRSSRPGFCFVLFFGPGTLARPARTACRNSRASGPAMPSGMRESCWSRASCQAWMRPRSARCACTGQMAPG